MGSEEKGRGRKKREGKGKGRGMGKENIHLFAPKDQTLLDGGDAFFLFDSFFYAGDLFLFKRWRGWLVLCICICMGLGLVCVCVCVCVGR